MSKVTKQVEVSKEASELGEAIVALVASAKQHMADGFQPGSDLPAIVSENFSKLLTAVQGMDQMPAEAKEDVAAFSKAFALPVADLAALFLKKEPAQA